MHWDSNELPGMSVHLAIRTLFDIGFLAIFLKMTILFTFETKQVRTILN